MTVLTHTASQSNHLMHHHHSKTPSTPQSHLLPPSCTAVPLASALHVPSRFFVIFISRTHTPGQPSYILHVINPNLRNGFWKPVIHVECLASTPSRMLCRYERTSFGHTPPGRNGSNSCRCGAQRSPWDHASLELGCLASSNYLSPSNEP